MANDKRWKSGCVITFSARTIVPQLHLLMKKYSLTNEPLVEDLRQSYRKSQTHSGSFKKKKHLKIVPTEEIKTLSLYLRIIKLETNKGKSIST